jgi:putative sterol carrier protein
MRLTLKELTARLRDQLAASEPVPGAMLLIVERVGLIHINGSEVSNSHKPADCTLWMNHSDFDDWLDGRLSTDEALMSGKLGIRGDIGIAAAAQPVFTEAWALRGQ